MTRWKADGQNQTRKLLTLKLRYVGITNTALQLELHFFMDKNVSGIKLQDFNIVS